MIGDKPMVMDDYYPVKPKHTPKPPLSFQAMPRAKRGDLKPMDQFEQDIIATAVKYVVTMFIPRSSVKAKAEFTTAEEAVQWIKEELPKDTKVRCAMMYGVDKDDHHALMCTLSQGQKDFKYPKLSYY